MKQLKNGYDERYYLTKDGKLYNSTTKKYVKANVKHSYKIKTVGNSYKNISLKSLYRLVYNEEYCIDNIVDIEGEHWSAIEGTGNMYFVSDKGRVKSYKGYEAILLNQYKTSSGYNRVDIFQEGSRRSWLVHRLVGITFLPMPESMDHQLHHKDFNKNNCSADNLEWLRPAEHSEIHKQRREMKRSGSSKSENVKNT